MAYRVGIVATYKTDGSPWPLEAVSKEYRIKDIMCFLQQAEARGEENVSFTISEDGKAGAFFDDGDYVFEEPNEGDYLPGITAADVNQAE